MLTQTQRERVSSLLFYGFVLLLAYLVFLLFRPFLVPLGWAAVLVIFFYPSYARLARRWGPTHAAALSTAAVTVIVVVPTWMIVSAFVRESVQAAEAVRRAAEEGRFAVLQRAWTSIQQRVPIPMDDLTSAATDLVQNGAGAIVSQAGAVLQNLAVFLFYLVVALFATFFLFRDGAAIMRGVRNAMPFDEPIREQVISQTRDLVYASITAGLLVAAVQGLLGGIAFALVGLPAPVFWGVIMGVLCLLPLGAWIIWTPAALWLALTGHVGSALVLAGIGAGVIGLVDNIMRPWLLSGRATLNGLLIFVSLLGGVNVFGALGLVLGPILVSTAAALLDVYTGRERPTSQGQAAGPGPG
jgi:predicted PurR-regulated permease PerM